MFNNFMWNDESFNDVYDGLQKNITHKEYILNDMVGIIDKGKLRKKQEDSLLMMEKNGVKLMAIADGMGGMQAGDIASNFTLLAIGLWFNKKNIHENMNEKELFNELKELLVEINTNVYRKYGGGTTLILAIKLKYNTITVNVGDSRIYIYNNDKLIQTSKDQSFAWYQYENGEILNKDDIRFYTGNHILNHYIGQMYLSPDNNIISNNDYENMILVSDGITDLISDRRMLYYIKHNKDNYEKDILDYCLNTKDYNYSINNEMYVRETNPGKDNASIIVYRKKN